IPYLGGRIATPDGARRRWSTWRVNRGLTGLCRSQHLAEAALPPGIVGERRPELRLAEVRPQPVGEVELRISAVPEKEIRQPLLAAGADQKIHRAGIRHRMVDIRKEALEFLDARTAVACGTARGLEDAVLGGVVDRNPQAHPRAVRRQ